MSFPGAPWPHTHPQEWPRRITDVVNSILRGRTNNYGTVTLTASVASTVVSLPSGSLSIYSNIIFDPLTDNAADELYGGTMYVTAANRDVDNQQFTITHSNNSQADREFRYCIIG